MDELIQKIAIYALPVLLAITLHEAAHAYVAKRFGDSTAYVLGRMTLNPLKHIDLVGTVLLPLLTLVPILPLDGGRIMESLLPRRLAYPYSRLEPYGIWILLGLIVTGLLTPILLPFINLMYHLLELFF